MTVLLERLGTFPAIQVRKFLCMFYNYFFFPFLLYFDFESVGQLQNCLNVLLRRKERSRKMTILPKKKSSSGSKGSEHLHRDPPGSQNPEFQLAHNSGQVKAQILSLFVLDWHGRREQWLPCPHDMM